ncbi:MAG TPA: hypothetical protein VFW07_18825 [Parafilimonas sp.]|nr:hypothetical protein [Parafilimonas sp.]
MKLFFFILFMATGTHILAQNANDTLQTVYYLPGNVNITISLLNKSSVTGDVWRFTDSSLMIYGRTSTGNIIFKYFNYSEIRSIKIKRYAFLQGMAAGFAVGSLIKVPEQNAYTDYYSTNTKAQMQVLAATAASTLIGGMVNTTIKKKRFKINGSKQKFQPVFEILMRMQ